MPKNIVLFSDGTGNSAAKLFKTNVWRLYKSIDLSEPDPTKPGKSAQIAYYDDGVGTSSFKPLAILGGAFGWGLKRNVIDLYTFLCRNYEPDDQIYCFGFSRGAFTIRVLTGLINSQGLVHAQTRMKRLSPWRSVANTSNALRTNTFTPIFDSASSKVQATEWLQTWRDAIPLFEIRGFDRFLTTLDNRMDEITNYFLDRQNSGFVEGFNNKIKALKRRCYGIFNLSHLFYFNGCDWIWARDGGMR